MPYLTKDLVDEALIGRNSAALFRIVILFAIIGAIGFVLNVASGLIYTRVSADILFDMRRELYEHLQRLSPRFYAVTRLGDIVSRLAGELFALANDQITQDVLVILHAALDVLDAGRVQLGLIEDVVPFRELLDGVG